MLVCVAMGIKFCVHCSMSAVCIHEYAPRILFSRDSSAARVFFHSFFFFFFA